MTTAAVRPINLNLSALARASGYSLAHVSKVFSGARRPSLACAKKLAEALGCGLDDLAEMLEQIEAKKEANH